MLRTLIVSVILMLSTHFSYALSLSPLDKDPHFGDLPALEKQGVIRVLVAADIGFYYIEAGQPRGILAELLYHFEKRLKQRSSYLNLQIIPVTRDELLPSLEKGLGDLAVANLTITPQREKKVSFSIPIRRDVEEWVITNRTQPSFKTINQLSGKEIWVRASSSYFESLQALNHKLNIVGKPPVVVHFLDENLQDYEIMEMVNQGIISATVLDSHKAKLWLRVMRHLKAHTSVPLREQGQIAWAMRKDSPKLKQFVDQYLSKYRSGTLMGNVIYGKYLNNTGWLKALLNPKNIEKLNSMSQVFVRYSDQYDFDPLMIAAQGYQESGLDQSKVSPKGAVGIMQVLPSTARDPNINIRNIYRLDNNVHAGVKYLRFLKNRYFRDREINEENQVYFSLAAYNAGPGNILKMRRIARQQGFDDNKWFKNVEIVTRRNIGREPVHYVSNINRYFIIYTQLSKLQKAAIRSNDSPPLIFPIESQR
ncbi:lytic transglycosylase F [Vibrio taketomensis]|uniref:transglycosylase SLT domain-containing protein n=1 Tax=Vibrio taketomensis TaxID=2572923 RepID=UPI0013897780|nr:lytic transglycosylase F [Vibrio taketomensis]